MSDNHPIDETGGISLESILAEFKGSAFIDGDRRTHEDILNEQVEQIMAETAGEKEEAAPVSDVSEPEPLPETPPEPLEEPEPVPESEEDPADVPVAAAEREEPAFESVFREDPAGYEHDASAPDEPLGEYPEPPAGDYDPDAAFVPDPSVFEEKEPAPRSSGKGFFGRLRALFSGDDPGDTDSDDTGTDVGYGAYGKPEASEPAVPGWPRVEPAEEEPVSAAETQEPDAGVIEEEPAAPVEVPGTEAPSPAAEEPPAPSGGDAGKNDGGEDTEILFFDDYRFSSSDEGKEFETAWEETYFGSKDGETEDGESSGSPFAGLSAVIGGLRKKRRSDAEGEEVPAEEPEPEEEVFVPEPDYASTAEAYAKKRHSLMLRTRIGLLLAAIMTIITILFERGVFLPGIEDNGFVLTLVLTICQIVVMGLAVDLLLQGGSDLIHLRPGAESILLLSSLAVILAGAVALARHDTSASAPFCCVSAFALSLSLWGEYRMYAAMALSLKTAAATDAPDVYISDYEPEIECTVIKHFRNTADGFYNNLTESDISETAFHVMAPILIVLAIVFSLAGSIGSQTSFLRCLSATAAASASFTALSAFSLPFSLVAKRLRRTGSAVAGWGGADTIYYADGIRIVEDDLFPAGATITGIRIFDNRKAEKIIRYTGSLLEAAGSGLSKPFSDFMEKQAISHMRIESYEICEGGFSAFVRSENILCGTGACLNLYGVQIPPELNMKNAMYVALDGVLSGVFTVGYRPTKNVQSSLNAMLRSRLKLFVGGRDFNISPLMVQQKLQIPTDDMEYLPFRQACSIARNEPEKVPHAAAVSVQTTPGTMAETLISAKRLRVISRINTVFAVLSTILGMLIMLVFARVGTDASVSPSNLCEYMLAMEVIVILISRIV